MGGCFDLRGNTLIISNKATIPEAFGTTLAHYPSSHSARFKTVIECAFYSNKLMLCRGIASPSFFFFQSVSSSDEVTAKANCRDLNECFSLKKFEAPLPKNTSTQKTSKVTQIVIQAKNPLQRFFFFLSRYEVSEKQIKVCDLPPECNLKPSHVCSVTVPPGGDEQKPLQPWGSSHKMIDE